MMQEPAVLFSEKPGQKGNLGIITLNRPSALNSLDHDMVLAMHKQLSAWAKAQSIKAVVIRAVEGRAFCAGGDLRATYDCVKAHDNRIQQFFHDEYHLNRLIFHYPKPYIALLDGITMGGGVGISVHGSHRVATDKLLFAMPETGIGFFPDVGGTYFLPRLPGKLGHYLGLTGARIKSDDCVALGIAQLKVTSTALPEIMQAIADQLFTVDARSSVTQVLANFKVACDSALMKHKTAIDNCFGHQTVEEIVSAAQTSQDEYCKAAVETIRQKSPTSLKVTQSALLKGSQREFDACMRQEYRLVTRFLQGHDFQEGIRAVIIDKDQKPQWQPDSLAGVSIAEVEQYFAPLEEELV